MFKKAVESKSQQRLSGADRKKLKRSLKDKFPRASDSDFDLLLPPKAEITVVKFQNRVHVYGVEGGLPMFFDIDGRGTDIFPTVYALWKVPYLLPAFELKGGEVSHFIIGGADLMFPGIRVPAEGLPSFLSGEIWAVMVPSNPAPIAVGTTTMSSVEALRAGLRGKALRVTHYYRDLLWESTEGRYVPNAGFLEDVVYEDPALLSSSEVSDLYVGVTDISVDQPNTVDINLSEAAAETDVHSELDYSYASQIDSGKTVDRVIAEVSNLKVSGDIPVDESTPKENHLSIEDVDALLDKCLLQGLHTTVKDKDLPLPGSTLWSNHVLPCRPSGVTLDIKKSSFKKLLKWLQAKSATGLIQVKEDKHKKEVVLCVINRKHPDYLSFKPEKHPVDKTDQTGDRTAGGNGSEKTLQVSEMYKPISHVNPIFTSTGADTGRLYTAAEATDIVFKYIEKENLVKPTNKSTVVLDAVLCDALFKGAIKKGTTYPTEIHKKDVGGTLVGRMQAHHVVTRGCESVVRKGSLKPIQIMTERRQGNKKVTKLWGMETFLMDAEALASELQKKFACSTTVAELPGKKGNEVLVQGGVIDDLARHLVEQYGIPKRYIEVLDKTKK